jgi:hypothetical protein
MKKALSVTVIIIVILFAACKKKNNYNIHVVERNNQYAVYDSNLHEFIYKPYKAEVIVDGEPITFYWITDTWGYGYWQPHKFVGYSTIDSAESAAEAWRGYGYTSSSK